METIEVKRNWFVMGNNWHLLVEVKDKIFHKTVIIYDTRPGFEDTLSRNKQLKEYNLIEEVKKLMGVKIKFI
jgi:hypothetical protein